MQAEQGPRNRDSGTGAFRLSLKAGAIYFALMLALGWVTGPIRELLIIPLFGQAIGISVEATIMIGAMFVAVRWIIWLLEVRSAFSARASMGLVAFCLLFPAEMAGAWILRGQSPIGFLFPPDEFFTAVQWGLLLLFAAMPLLVREPWTFGGDIAS